MNLESTIRELVVKYGEPFINDFGKLEDTNRFNQKHEVVINIYNTISYDIPAWKISELLVDELTVYILDSIPTDTNFEIIEWELLEMIELAFAGEFQNKITKNDLIERIDWDWLSQNYPV